jgi:hypothetical protein
VPVWWEGLADWSISSWKVSLGKLTTYPVLQCIFTHIRQNQYDLTKTNWCHYYFGDWEHDSSVSYHKGPDPQKNGWGRNLAIKMKITDLALWLCMKLSCKTQIKKSLWGRVPDTEFIPNLFYQPMA